MNSSASTQPSSRFQLTLSTDYCADWGLWEGVRELIQNALDGEQDGHVKTISHDGLRLSVANQGVILQRSVWLLGTSSKGNGTYRGCFGEGLKLGVLALVRAGYRVLITNGDELWIPSIQPSDEFGIPVLTIEIQPNSEPATDGFAVHVDGVSTANWRLFSERFLGLQPARQIFKQGDRGTSSILLDPERAGQLYVKGIFVQDIERYHFGYDLNTATDRDRRMVDASELRSLAARTWAQALESEVGEPASARVLTRACYQAMLKEAPDLEMLHYYLISNRSEGLADLFIQLNGDKALPVVDPAGQAEALRFGFQPVVCPRPLRDALANDNRLHLDTACKEHRTTLTAQWSPDDLSAREDSNLLAAISLLSQACKEADLPEPGQIGLVRVVEFRAEEVLSQTRGGEDGKPEILIARRCLRSLGHVLQVLSHEMARFKAANPSDPMHNEMQTQLLAASLAHLHETAERLRSNVREARGLG